MSILQRLGVIPFINAVGPFTAYGGAFQSQESLQAMNEIASVSLRIDHLQAAASRIISKMTHAEAGIVTAGASAALTLGTAACIAGYDVAKMNRLPDTRDIPNEVIMPWHHMTGYTHAIRAAGANVLGVGLAKAFTPAHEQHLITTWEIEAKITDKTAALAYTIGEGNCPPLEEVTALGQKYNIPVVVDAAPMVPPLENLYGFIDRGADLVCISGGKGLCGPQASGILCGRRDLIASAALQMFDYGGSYDKWSPPPSLIPKEKLRGIPERGIGRAMKVSKEAIVGLITSLEGLTEVKYAERTRRLRGLLHIVLGHIKGLAGVEVSSIDEDSRSDPSLIVKLHEKAVGKSAAQICAELKQGDPIIYVGDMYIHQHKLSISPLNLNEETAEILGERLRSTINV